MKRIHNVEAKAKWVFGDAKDPENLVVYLGREMTRQQLAEELYRSTGQKCRVSYETHLNGPGDYVIDVVIEEVDDDEK